MMMSTRGSVVTPSSENSESTGVPADRQAEELHVAIGDGPDQAPDRGEERLDRGRARFCQRRRAVNPVVDDDQDTVSGGVLAGRHRDRVEEVERAVGREGRGAAASRRSAPRVSAI